MKSLQYIVCVVSTLLFLSGKPIENDPIDVLLENGQYTEAASLLQEAYNNYPSDSMALQIGEIYTQAKQFKNALTWFDKSNEIETADSSRFLLLKGDAQLGAGDYEKSGNTYRLYAGLTGNQSVLNDRLMALENLKRAVSLSDGWMLQNLSCNTSSDEWVVTNFRTRELIISNMNAPTGSDKSSWFDFFTLEREFDKWLPPKPLMKPEDETHNMTGVSFSPDGNSVYFVRYETVDPQAKGKSKGMTEIRTRLYAATTLGNHFSDIVALPFNQDGYRIKDPCIDVTGKLLYFAANMPGGYGGYDIYVTKNINGRWILPENLGSNVNSPYDDFSPYVRQDKTDGSIYFASDRPYGFGGLDLYKSSLENGRWLKAEILPPPFNSPEDEYSIMYDQGKMTGYLTSNRKGGKGGFDVYRFIPSALTVSVVVKDTLSQSVAYASVMLNQAEGMTDNTGSTYFSAQPDRTYRVQVKSDHYESVTKDISTNGQSLFDTLEIPITLDKLSATAQPVEAQYIDFHLYVKDSKGNILPNYVFTIINLQSSKVRNVEADENGLLEQVFMPNNDYRLILVDEGVPFSEKITTRGALPGGLLTYELIIDHGSYSLTKK